MLGRLFGSNSRVQILKLFLSQPEKSFYIRQIARDLDLQLNSVRRELENLEKFGLLQIGEERGPDGEEFEKTSEKGKKNKAETIKEKKFYCVNSGFTLYGEIRNLMMKSQVLCERDFVQKIQKMGKIRLFILTGCFVNEVNAKVDLLLIGKVNKDKVIRIIQDLERNLGREINFTLMDEKEFKYRRDMTDVFLFDILERKKIIVVDELGVG